jgi:hypothetical protein
MVTASGPVAGEALIAGGNVTVTGDVGNTLRIVGGNVTLEGAVAHDLVAAGGNITVGGAGVAGDAMIAGGNVTITAPVKGNVRIYAGDVTIDSAVGGNVSIHAKKVILGANAKIKGNFIYTSPEGASVNAAAVITGSTTYTKAVLPAASSMPSVAAIAAVVSILFLIRIAMTLVGALVIGLTFKRFSQTAVERALTNVWAEIGRGLIVMIVLPIASIILMITVIGIPLGVIGFLAFGLLVGVTSLAVPIVAGSLIHKWIWKPAQYVVNWKTILLGTLAYLVLSIIPILGWIALLGLTLMTLGAIVSIKWEAIKEWR